MKKEAKDTIIVELGQKLKEYPHFYLVDVTGMNAEDTSNLRRKCFKQQIKMVVVKNTLLHKALEATETDFSDLYGALKGNTAVLFCETANVPAKLLKDKEIAKAGVPSLRPLMLRKVFRWCRQARRVVFYQEQERGYCRCCRSLAVSCKERYFCSAVRRWHHSRCA